MGTSFSSLRLDIDVVPTPGIRAINTLDRKIQELSKKIKSGQTTSKQAQSAQAALGRELTKQYSRAELAVAKFEARSNTANLKGAEKIRAQAAEVKKLAERYNQLAGSLKKPRIEIEGIDRAATKMIRNLERNQRRTQGFFQGRVSGQSIRRGLAAGVAAIGLTVGVAEAAQLARESTQVRARILQNQNALDSLARSGAASRTEILGLERALGGLPLEPTTRAIERLTRAGVTTTTQYSLLSKSLDIAARSGESFEDVIGRITRGVAKQEVEILDELGIFVRLDTALKNFTQTLGITNVALLTAEQRSEAFAQEVDRFLKRSSGEFATLAKLPKLLLEVGIASQKAKEGLGALFEDKAEFLLRGASIVLKDIEATANRLTATHRIGLAREEAARDPEFQASLRRGVEPIDVDPRGIVRLRNLEHAFINATRAGRGQEAARRLRDIDRLNRATFEGVVAQSREATARLRPPDVPSFGTRTTQEFLDTPERLKRIADAKKDALANEKRAIEGLAQVRLKHFSNESRILDILFTQLELTNQTARAKSVLLRTASLQLRAEEDIVAKQQEGLLAKGRAQIRNIATGVIPFDVDPAGGLTPFRRAADALQRQALQTELDTLTRGREAALENLQLRSDDSLQAKLFVEQEKLKIEQGFLKQSAALQIRQIELRTAQEIRENTRQREALEAQNRADVSGINEKLAAAMESAAKQSTIAANRVLRTEYDRTFRQIENQVGTLFDALVSRTRSFGDAIRQVLLSALLTPVKRIVSQAVASFLTGAPRAVGGGGVGAQGGGLGSLANLFSFGGLGGISRPGAPGGTTGFGGPVNFGFGGLGGISRPGAPGGTGGFGGPVRIGGGSVSQFAQFSGLLDFLKSGRFEAATRGVPGLGVGGPTGLSKAFQSNAAGLAGFALAADGLRRGGLVGLGETTAGGALIGARFGGGVGAAIGAAIGAAVGGIRLLFKSPAEKVKQKVQQLYQVKLSNPLADRIAQIAQQQFGGDIDIAIRRDPALTLIRQFAALTGNRQQIGPLLISPQLSSRAGQLFQRPTFVNGQPFILEGNLQPDPSFIQAGSQVITLNIDGEPIQARAVQAMRANPNEIAAGVSKSSASDFRRAQNFALGASPSAVLA